MPGPPKKPTRLKVLEGNRGHQKLNKAEPVPALGMPVPPDWFDEQALKIWNLIAPELDRLGLLSKIDGAALEGACQAYSTAVACRKIINEEGMVMKVGEHGYEQQRPEVAIELKAWAQFRSFCAEFGLTPAARGKLSAPMAPKIDAIESALCG